MSKKILVIAVHPDDETLGCGGAILKHKNAGDKVYYLIVTRAHQKIALVPELAKLQQSYIKEVTTKYKFNGYKQLDFLTAELDNYSIGEIISSISAYIKDIKPGIIYLNHFSDTHSDHKIAFNAIYSATKNFRHSYIERILLYETLSETEYGPAISKNAFNPNVFIDISAFLDIKIEIMKVYAVEMMEEPLPRAESSIRALARYRGSRIGVMYAEAFELIFEKI